MELWLVSAALGSEDAGPHEGVGQAPQIVNFEFIS